MYILSKNGDYVVNRATYEYMCDSIEDLDKIPKEKITLGSTAIVICEGGIKVFFADGQDNWVEVTDDVGGGSGSSGGSEFKLTKDAIIAALGYTPAEARSEEGGEDNQKQFDDINDKIEDHEERIVKLEEESGSSSEQPVKPAGKMKLLNEVIADGTYAVLTLDKDDAENAYNLSNLYIEMEMKKGAKASSIRVAVNDIDVALINTAIATGTAPMKSSVKCEANGVLFAMNSAATNSATAAVNLQAYPIIGHGEVDAINNISIVSASAINFPKDSVIKVYGC